MKQYIEVNFKMESDLVLVLCNIVKPEYMRASGTMELMAAREIEITWSYDLDT